MRAKITCFFILAPVLAAVLAAVSAAPGAPARADDAVPWRHAIAMHGEPKYAPGFTHFDYVNPDAPKGGVTRRAGIGSFDSFNPFILKGDAAAAAGAIYDTLLTESADEAFTYYGLLAESIQTPGDRSWAAFKLRENARWHDGEPVTPDDVVWTFKALTEKGHPQYRHYYGSVTDVRKTGPRTVRFDFRPGSNLELPLILGQLPVLPKHYWETRDFEKAALEPPLGSGPYRIGKFEAGRYVELERVEDYWAGDLAVSKGFYNYDRIRYDYYRDTNVALEAFKSGEYDLRAENSSKAWATAYDFPAARKGWVIRDTFEDKLPSGMQAYAFNLRRAKFRDPQVRWALAHAFDFEWSNKNLFYGQYKHTRSFFDHSELAAAGLPSGAELALLNPLRGQIPDEVFTQEYNPPKTDGSGRLRANLRKAGKIMDDAGWVLKNGERIDPETGAPLTFEFLLVSPLFERITLPIIQNLKKLGVTASVRTVDPSQYQHLTDTFDFDVIVSSWGQTLSPGNEQREFWGSAAADQPGSRNTAGLKSPAVDALIEHVIAAESREALITAVRALDRVLQWSHFVIPQWHAGYDRIAYWDIFGMPGTVPLRGVQTGAWWIVPEKQKALSKQLKSAQE